MKDETLIKKALNTTSLESLGISGGGCISKGSAYLTDFGKIFLKENSKPKTKIMFEGEFVSLEAISRTNTILCPKPIKLIENGNSNNTYLAMQYLKINQSSNQGKLGTKLAELHLYNSKANKKEKNYTNDYGFSVPTCCGYIPQNNTWNSDWINFFIEQRLQSQIDLIKKEYNDSEVQKKWEVLKPLIPSYFADLTIEPSLLHGDLWSGNIGQTDEGEPVIFDPASFYGHHEYELGIAKVFGGFNTSFYSAYHKLIPRAKGFEERNKLYQLFHYLNHWYSYFGSPSHTINFYCYLRNHFGTGYKSSAMNIINSFIN